MTGVAMYRGRHLMNNPTANPPLPDLGFELIPDFHELCNESQIESYFLLCVMSARLSLLPSPPVPLLPLIFFLVYTLIRMMIFQPGGINIFCRFAVVDGLLMFLRGTTIVVTSVRSPLQALPQTDTQHRPLALFVLLLLC